MDESTTTLRVCNFCGIAKPETTEFFYAHKASRLGLMAKCKTCVSEHARIWRKENPEKVRAKDAASREKHRAKRIAYNTQWNKTAKAREGLARRRARPEDKARRSARQKAYEARPEVKERKAERNRIWKKNNKDRVCLSAHRRRMKIRQSTSHYSVEDVRIKLEHQSGLCYWCKKPMEGKYTVDHIIPISKGGDNSAANICLAHASCNFQKSFKMPWEFNGRLL